MTFIGELNLTFCQVIETLTFCVVVYSLLLAFL